MSNDAPGRPVNLIRKLLPYTSIACILALLYVGWTFFHRWDENRRAERAAEAEKVSADKKITDMYGSGNLKILSFYASPSVLTRGQRALICYGVSNATAVRIEPAVDPVKPALSQCIEIAAPAKDTRYTLTAEDAAGHTDTESFLLRIR